jgi:broad specificity phosphatase PhoE
MFLERVLMKLYLIRHGQSEANFNKAHSGWGAIGLTAEGRAQAEKILSFYRRDRFFFRRSNVPGVMPKYSLNDLEN